MSQSTKSLVAMGVVALMGGAAMAQTAPTEPFVSDGSQTVVIACLRAESPTSQTIKKNADEVAEAVFGDAIGELPDHSINDVLQRVVGVTIERSMTSDPRHGSSMAMRGLNYVRSELNGHDFFSAGGGRAFDHQQLLPDLISSIEVTKTPSAHHIEGAIGGVVNLHTVLPLEDYIYHPRDVVWGRARYSILKDGRATPSASVLIASQLDTPIGDIGVLANLAGTTSDKRNGSLDDPTRFEHDRSGQYFAFQWRPQRDLRTNLTYFKSRDRLTLWDQAHATERDAATTDLIWAIQWRLNFEWNLSTELQHIDTTSKGVRGGAAAAASIQAQHPDYARVGSKAWRGDLKYTVDSEFLDQIRVGVRLAERTTPDAGDPRLANPSTLASVGTDPAQLDSGHEKSAAIYTQLGFYFDRSAYSIDGNVGIRYIKTDSTAPGHTGFSLGPIVENSYSNLLPSFNLRWRNEDKLQFRLGLSKAMARPDFSPLQAQLKPTMANQIDLSAEWFFARPGSLTVALFDKRLKDIIINQLVSDQRADANGVMQRFTRTVPINGTSGTTRGVELAYLQHFTSLPEWASGLGAQANLTFVDGRLAGGRPLPGSSRQSANVGLMFDDEALSAHLGYNWRSRYLHAVDPYGVSSLPSDPPLWVRAYGQLDASVFYKVSKKLSFGLEANNLNNATFRPPPDQVSGTGEQMRFVQGRRYSAHMRYTF